MDGFVLCAVILEDCLYVFYARDYQYVQEKDKDTDDPIDYIECKVIFSYQSAKNKWKYDKKTYCEEDGYSKSDDQLFFADLIVAVLDRFIR